MKSDESKAPNSLPAGRQASTMEFKRVEGDDPNHLEK
jgi:hypothetical protein